MKKTLKPWILVVTGILFNIASAIITHYFIGINNQQLAQLELEINKLDTLIDSQWRSKTELERKQEFLLLLVAQPQHEEATGMYQINQLVASQLTEVINQFNLSASLG